jgi:hypothetical protein
MVGQIIDPKDAQVMKLRVDSNRKVPINVISNRQTQARKWLINN